MGHTVKLSLFGQDEPTTEVTYAIDTSNSAYNLMEKEVITKTLDPEGNEHVIETMRIDLAGTNLADLRAKLATIYDFCDQVRRDMEGKNPMFGMITIRHGGGSNALYRSRLYAIEASIQPTVLESEWATARTEVLFVYERDNYWEGVDIQSITISNGNGSAADVLQVSNCNDGAGTSPYINNNYFDLDKADIDGDVPTPLIIRYNNAENDANGVARIYAGGIAVYSTAADPTPFIPTLFIEAESATGGTGAADATCSGGNKVSVSLTTAAETTLLTWALTNPKYYYGYWYKVIARFAAITSLGNIKWRWKLKVGVTEVWSGPQFMTENATNIIQEMGEVPIAPDVEWSGQLSLVLTGQRTTGSTETAVLDYIQLLPSHAAMKVQALGSSVLEFTYSLYMPTWNGKVTRSYGIRDWYSQWNSAIMAYPGMYTRVHFVVQTETGGTAEIDRMGQLMVQYRKRYRSIAE